MTIWTYPYVPRRWVTLLHCVYSSNFCEGHEGTTCLTLSANVIFYTINVYNISLGYLNQSISEFEIIYLNLLSNYLKLHTTFSSEYWIFDNGDGQGNSQVFAWYNIMHKKNEVNDDDWRVYKWTYLFIYNI